MSPWVRSHLTLTFDLVITMVLQLSHCSYLSGNCEGCVEHAHSWESGCCDGPEGSVCTLIINNNCNIIIITLLYYNLVFVFKCVTSPDWCARL